MRNPTVCARTISCSRCSIGRLRRGSEACTAETQRRKTQAGSQIHLASALKRIPNMLQRFLDPATLATLSSLDLVARTVVDGFVAGLHRSPEFGFSQEFAEYRAYTPGDDLRHMDWNVFARTEKMYLKRYKGETNSQLLILLDTSASMGFGSTGLNKLDYARYLSASLAYLGNLQRDATGLIVFDADVTNYIPPSTRQGQLPRLLHAIEHAAVGIHTDFAKPFLHFQQFLRRRGIVTVIYDFYDQP